MALDGLVLHTLTHELSAALSGGRISKIYQPNDNDILLVIRAKGDNYRLLISAHPTYPRLHFTKHTYSNPLEPPMFCMLLRKHLEGGVIESLTQQGMERILHIDVKSRDELGDEAVRRMIIEIMGRHSNIILTDPSSNQILDSIRHVTPAMSQHRVVLPGRPYQDPPHQGKLNPLTVNHDKFVALLDMNAGKLDKQLVELYSGISPLIAREIVYRSGLSTRESVWEAFSGIMFDVEHHRIEPRKIADGDRSYFYVLPLQSVSGDVTVFPTVSECLDEFYYDKADRDEVKQRAGDLIRYLTNEYDKNAKKIEKLRHTLDQAQEADVYRLYGELLTAHIYMVKKGDREARVTNYYEEGQPELVIPLDPQLSPSENAQRYFKKYNKAKNSVAIVQEQIQIAEQEMGYFEALLLQVESASVEDIEEIREELMEGGYIRYRNRKGRRKKKDDKPRLSVYTSSEGFVIYVGKNNKQNDYLTVRFASAQDTWLHTKDIPGSHVVIRGKDYGEATLFEAAMLAAYYSKAKASSQVPVDYTLVKHVKKPSGAKPGYVIYDNQKTLYVTPDESLIKKLGSGER